MIRQLAVISTCLALILIWSVFRGGGSSVPLMNVEAATKTANKSHHGSTPLTEPGNDAFGAIQEVIRVLEADPNTDWSKVNLEALRQHLVDMHNMTLNVTVLSQKPVDNGVEILVLPDSAAAGASLDRVFAAHPAQLERETGWKMTVRKNNDKYDLLVTTQNLSEVAKVRGLGYIGILATGVHHQLHHWAMATGQHPHSH